MIGALMLCLVVALCAKYIYGALIQIKACITQQTVCLNDQTTAHTNTSANICRELKWIADVINDVKSNDVV